jgi:glycosyltransferase involved in cell wall biosynthesis
MRILHIISSFSAGGAEVYVRDLSAQMVSAGHDVCVAYVSDATSLGRSVDFEEDFKAYLSMNGVVFFEIGHVCRRRMWCGARQLRKVVDDFKPDVIHSHLYYGLMFKILSLLRVPTVYTHHSSCLGKGRYLYPFFRKMGIRFIGISKDCSRILSSAGADNVVTIYNGVSRERLILKQEYSVSKIPIKIISVGSLMRPKNHSLLLTSFAELLTERPDLRTKLLLQIAGEGVLKNEIQRQIECDGLSESVVLLGNRKDVPELLHDADLFVMSSDWEGLPIALLEAMMTGLPVVVTDVGGCRDVVEGCNAGFVVAPGSVDLLSEHIERMVDSPQLRRNFSANALEGAKKYSIESALKSHIDFYACMSKTK